MNYKTRDQRNQRKKRRIIEYSNQIIQERNRQADQIFSIRMHDYISSQKELKQSLKREPGTSRRRRQSSLAKEEDELDVLLKKQLKRPIGAIADDIQEFLNAGMGAYVRDTMELAGDLLDQRGSDKHEVRSRKEILDSVRFHAENKILYCGTPGQIRGPEALTEVNAVDNVQQVHYLLENGQNVCVYGQGSQMYCLRNYVIEKMKKTHLVFEMLGFMKKAVFRNMVTNFLNQSMKDRHLRLSSEDRQGYNSEIVKMKKPRIDACFKYLSKTLHKMGEAYESKTLFVIYKLEHLLEKERDFLEEFFKLREEVDVKVLFTIENFQTFWKNVRPSIINKLMINFIPIHTFETQTFELESLNLTFNVNSSMKNFYSFLAIFSSFNDTMKEFLFYILLMFADEKKRELRSDVLYKRLCDEMIVNSRNIYNLYLKEPLDHRILEVKTNHIRHFYTSGTLNRIIRKVLKLEPKIAERHLEIVNRLNLDDSDSEAEEPLPQKKKPRQQRIKSESSEEEIEDDGPADSDAERLSEDSLGSLDDEAW